MNKELKIKLLKAGYGGVFDLDDLISSCGDILLYKIPGSKWVAVRVRSSNRTDFTEDYVNHEHYEGITGDTPKEAVAKLYLHIYE